MTLISFQDAVTASNLNPDAQYAVYYADGAFANRTAVAARCPHAKLFGITVRGLTGHGIFACDSETGDLDVAQTEMWVAEQIRLGVELICVYANLDRWVNGGLLAGLAKYGHRIKRWVADYNNVPAIPSWADADQYADPGPIDKDVALANFFGTAQPAQTTGVLHFAGTFDAKTGVWTIVGEPGQDVVFAGPAEEASAELQVRIGAGGGTWRIKGEPFNAAPLGS